MTAFIIDFGILFFFGKLFSFKGRGIRLLVSSAIGGIAEILPWIVPFSVPMPIKLPIIYIGVPALLLAISYQLKTWRDYAKGFLFYYSIVFLTGGILQWCMRKFQNVFQGKYNMIMLLGVILFTSMFFKKGAEILREQLSLSEVYFPTELIIGNSKITCMAFLDTGNQLFDPISQKPVIILEKRLLEENNVSLNEQNYRVIPYKSIGNKDGLLEGFIADRLLIKDSEQIRVAERVIIGIYDGELSKERSYEMILHPMLLADAVSLNQ